MKLLRFALLAALAAHYLPAFSADTARKQASTSESGESSKIVARYLLMDANGRAVTHEDFPGYFQLIAFGYTFCPDICPTTLAEMSVIIEKLGEQSQRLQPLFVTVDPERDTSANLRTYTAFFHPRILGLTGSPALVRRAADNFKVRYEKAREPGAPLDQYAVDHSAGMYLLGPNGSYIRKFAYATPPAEIAEHIGRIMSSVEDRPRDRRNRANPE